jgi:two-component system LytT family response regulator
VPEGVKTINRFRPQLVFLDIEMSPYSGFDLLEMVSERDFEVIFTTSYQQYALQAIKASALDYIEKPVTYEKLKEAIDRYQSKTGIERISNLLNNFRLANEHQKIALLDNGGYLFYELGSIIRCESDNSYTEFFIIDKDEKGEGIRKIIISKGLNYFENILLESGIFFRVHNQHLINIYHIKKFVKSVKDEGSYLVMSDNPAFSVPIARARKNEFIAFLKNRNMLI